MLDKGLTTSAQSIDTTAVGARFSAIQVGGVRALKQGGRVSCDVVQGPKGDQAQNIQAAEEVAGDAITSEATTG